MTKPRSIKTQDLEKYSELSLRQIEEKINQAQSKDPRQRANRDELRILNVALKDRQKKIKREVALFEEGNDRHLLLFESTSNYYKLIGNSALIYACAIAGRLGRRYNLRPDTDGYSNSADGVISIRDFEALSEQLKGLNIIPDLQLSHDELYFFKLPRVYSESKIDSFRKQIKISYASPSINLKKTTVAPELYMKILELQQRAFYCHRQSSDVNLRNYLLCNLVDPTRIALNAYVGYANNQPIFVGGSIVTSQRIFSKADYIPRSPRACHLFQLLVNMRLCGNNLVTIDNLKLLRVGDIGKLRLLIDDVERLGKYEYNKQLKHDRSTRLVEQGAGQRL